MMKATRFWISMGLIEDELQEVRKLCERVVDGSKLVSCVQTMVRVEIRRNNYKNLVVCLQFPSDYPNSCILIELKSKSLSLKLLDGLTLICESEAKKILGKPQVLPILKFIRNFIDENPLSCCYDEISSIKKDLLTSADELKLKQKTSTIIVKINQNSYFLRAKISVPDEYPSQAVDAELDTNLPPVFYRWLIGQSQELARQSVQPPLIKKGKKSASTQQQQNTFTPKPSLWPVVEFLITQFRLLPEQNCQLCKEICFPKNPEAIEVNESADKHVERVYCGHLFHLCCLITYMKTPPFKGGKRCPACNQQIFHDKWRVGENLAEKRWAHYEARQRELEEVADFLQ